MKHTADPSQHWLSRAYAEFAGPDEATASGRTPQDVPAEPELKPKLGLKAVAKSRPEEKPEARPTLASAPRPEQDSAPASAGPALDGEILPPGQSREKLERTLMDIIEARHPRFVQKTIALKANL